MGDVADRIVVVEHQVRQIENHPVWIGGFVRVRPSHGPSHDGSLRGVSLRRPKYGGRDAVLLVGKLCVRMAVPFRELIVSPRQRLIEVTLIASIRSSRL